MKHANPQNRLNNIFIPLVALIALGALCFGITETGIPQGYFFLFGAVATMYIGLLTTRHQHDVLSKDLFSRFNEQYGRLQKNLKLIAKKANDTDLDEEDKSVIVAYLNLCAEEFYWHKKGRIDCDVWNNWTDGMNRYIQIERIRSIVFAEACENASYYGLFDNRENFIHEGLKKLTEEVLRNDKKTTKNHALPFHL